MRWVSTDIRKIKTIIFQRYIIVTKQDNNGLFLVSWVSKFISLIK